jgi:hypothetical protein
LRVELLEDVRVTGGRAPPVLFKVTFSVAFPAVSPLGVGALLVAVGPLLKGLIIGLEGDGTGAPGGEQDL